MIFVNTSHYEPSSDWRERARRFTEAMQGMDPTQRATFIKDHSSMWRELKPELEQISHIKCYYCERKAIREPLHVDHYRPKNRIKNKDGTEEEGYWWLAFKHTNLRLACNYCNCPHTGADGVVRGKSDQFPLDSNCTRASFANSDLANELPLLLDPTNVVDPSLLWIMDDGSASPKESGGGLPQRRAIETIDILNLNDTRLVEARRNLWIRCQSLLTQADAAFARYNNSSNAGYVEYQCIIMEMLDLVSSTAEFSSTARACFRGSRYHWVIDSI